MYMITEAEGKIRIPPSKLGQDIESIVEGVSCEQFEGRMEEDRSFTILVSDVRAEGLGNIVHGDGAVHQTVKYKRLAYIPKDGEVVVGVVVEVNRFGAFVRFGPLDGLIHVSQVMDDHVDVDEVNHRLVGKDTGRSLGVGDRVKARISSLSFDDRTPQDSKIGLTMRQPGLGKLQWLEEDANGSKADSAKKSKKGSDE